jgi:hypothetical protein
MKSLSPVSMKWLYLNVLHEPLINRHHSALYNAEVKNSGNIPVLPHTPSWHCAQLIEHRDDFTFTDFYTEVSNL